MIALIGASAVVLTPIVTDALKARRDRIVERTKTREREAGAALRALRDALAAKDQEIAGLRQDRDAWRDHALSMGDGWYGQRRSR